MSGKKLTEKQKAVLRFIRDFIEKNGYPPTDREIADGIGLSSHTTAYSHVHALKEKGYLITKPGIPRSIVLTEKGREAAADAGREEKQ